MTIGSPSLSIGFVVQTIGPDLGITTEIDLRNTSCLTRYTSTGIMSANMKSLEWVGPTKDDLRNFPDEVRSEIGYALYLAQAGEKHPDAKPLRGFGGASVLEVVADFDRDTYRAVYTVQFEDAVYVLHVFQKKAKHGIATPREDLDSIRKRLQRVEQAHREGRGKTT